MTVRKLGLIALVPMILAGCAGREGEITAGGITAVRSACPRVGVPAGTGDITLFNPPASTDARAIDVVAVLTNVQSSCNDQSDQVYTNVTFDVQARRANAQGARTVTLPYFVTVVQGGNAVVAKRIGQVSVQFADGQLRAEAKGSAGSYVDRSAATLPEDIRREITRPRKAGDTDAATDPLARPEIRQAVQRATFEALVGFQLTDAQLKYNATR